jgi:hypothetical protein
LCIILIAPGTAIAASTKMITTTMINSTIEKPRVLALPLIRRKRLDLIFASFQGPTDT